MNVEGEKNVKKVFVNVTVILVLLWMVTLMNVYAHQTKKNLDYPQDVDAELVSWLVVFAYKLLQQLQKHQQVTAKVLHCKDL